MSKFGTYSSSKAALRKVDNVAKAVRSGRDESPSYITEMPRAMKHSTAYISAITFVVSAIFTVFLLAPDSKDLERTMELDQQFSQIKDQVEDSVN